MAEVTNDKLIPIKGSEFKVITNPDGATFMGFKGNESICINFKDMLPIFGVTNQLGQSETLAVSQKLFTNYTKDGNLVIEKTYASMTALIADLDDVDSWLSTSPSTLKKSLYKLRLITGGICWNATLIVTQANTMAFSQTLISQLTLDESGNIGNAGTYAGASFMQRSFIRESSGSLIGAWGKWKYIYNPNAEDIEYVKVEGIVDDLETERSDLPLSALQGAVLKSELDSIVPIALDAFKVATARFSGFVASATIINTSAISGNGEVVYVNSVNRFAYKVDLFPAGGITYYSNWMGSKSIPGRDMFMENPLLGPVLSDKIYLCNDKIYLFSKTEGKLKEINMDLSGYAKKEDLDEKTKGNGVYNVSQVNNKYDYETSALARSAVPIKFRYRSQIIVYSLHTGKIITEQFTSSHSDGWAIESNWKKLHSIGGLVELIPYSDQGTANNGGYAFYYLNQSALKGIPFNRIRAYFTKIGTFTVTVATGIPSTPVVVKTWQLTIPKTGEQIITLPEEITLSQGQYVGFGNKTDTTSVRTNMSGANPVGGGYAWFGTTFGSSNTRNLNTGIIATAAEIDGNEGGESEGDNSGEESLLDTSIRGFNRTKEPAVQALAKKIGGLATVKKQNIFSFIHFSDIHGSNIQIKRVFEAINDYPTIQFGINCGDIVSANFNNDFQAYQQISLASKKIVYHCLGNHDLIYGNTALANTKYMQPFFSKWGVSASNKNYYYRDISGVRFIFMDEYESQQDATNNSYYSNEQLSWLIDTLRSATRVIIVTHQPPGKIIGTGLKKPSGEIITGINDFFDYNTNTIISTAYTSMENPVRDIVEAWKQGGSLSKTYTATGLEPNVVEV